MQFQGKTDKQYKDSMRHVVIGFLGMITIIGILCIVELVCGG